MKNLASGSTAGPLSGKLRKFAVYAFLGVAMLAPVQAFATTCVKTTTRYYILGYEYWRTETVACAHGDN